MADEIHLAEQQLTERARHLLRVLVEKYISDGQPVGSRTLSRAAGLELSAATIRNVMADLEELGLVVSPHTSAGRVPTARGFRFFVDSLVSLKRMEVGEIEQLRSRLIVDGDGKELVENASRLLSDMTHMAGLVMVPRRARFALRHVEFLPIGEGRVLAILVVNERGVQNRVIKTERQYSESELQQAANYLNEHFVGRDVLAVRDALVAELDETRDSMNRLMLTAIDVASAAFSPASDSDDYVISGETRLMALDELSDVAKLRQLFEAFQRKRQLLGLLDRCLQADGMHIFIGEEAGQTVFDECSVVTSTYAIDGEPVGVLGVIGPTRMDYERVIPVVDVTAKLLGAALKSG
jgi:heat-inducible transcriptional repressor